MPRTRTTAAPSAPAPLGLAVARSRDLRHQEECSILRSALCRRYPAAAHGLQGLYIHPKALRLVDLCGGGPVPAAIWRRVERELVAVRTDAGQRLYFVSTAAAGIRLPPCRTLVRPPGGPVVTVWNAFRTREPDLLWLLGGREARSGQSGAPGTGASTQGPAPSGQAHE
jgi:hypothetical protein